MPASPLILTFKQIDSTDTALVGNKAIILGDMFQAGIPILKGFVVTAKAYEQFIFENALEKQINEFLSNLNISSPDNLEFTSNQLQSLILKNKISMELSDSISDAYNKQFKKLKNVPVSTISSPVLKYGCFLNPFSLASISPFFFSKVSRISL